MTTLLLINEKSGTVLTRGLERCLELAEAISPRGHDVIAGPPAELVAAAESAARQPDVARVVLIAGDGTMAAVAGALAGSGKLLVPLPGGTMNLIARDLGFSADLEAAIREVAKARPAPIDVAFVNGRAFLNNAVLGVYTVTAKRREAIREAETLVETASATADFLSALTQAEPDDYRIVIDGKERRVRTNTLMVSNNLYGAAEAFRPARARLDEGKLGVYMPQAGDAFDFLSVIFEATAGDLSGADGVSVESGSRCIIHADGELLTLSVDGEVMEIPPPAEFSIRPRALNVLSLRQDA